MAHLRLGLLPPLALSLVLAGCASDDNGGDEDPVIGERNCGEGIGECPDNERCLGGHCIPREGEGDETGEGEGEAGGEIACVPTCTGDQECGPAGQCLEPDRCNADEDCRLGRVCAVHHRCTDICEPSECPRVGLCRLGSCVPPRSCERDADCSPGVRCSYGLCYPACSADRECPSRQTCGAGGACEPPVTCSSHRDCPPNQDCVDGACTVPEEGGCDPDDSADQEACGPGLACGPTGECGRRLGCEEDAECPGVCDRYGLCAGCRVNGDCPSAQICLTLDLGVGICSEPADCLADEDCLRGRICGATGRCEPPDDCEEDRLEGNDRAETAYFVEDTSLRNLRRCPGVDDWFRVFVPTGFGAEVYLRDHDDAGLRLEMFREADPSTPIAVSDAPGSAERLPIASATNVQQVLLRVAAPLGATGLYDLDIRLRSDGRCLDDPAEDWAGDDGPFTAYPLRGTGGTVRNRRLCADDDWFQVTVEVLSRLHAVLVTSGAALSLSLFDPDGVLIPTDPASPNEVSVGGLLPGRYRMVVSTSSGQGANYSLDWRLSPDEEHLLDRCREATTLVSGQRWVGSLTAEQPDEFRGACAPNEEAAPEAVARIDIEGLSDISVRVVSADFEPVLYLRRGCAGGTRDATCAHSPPELFGSNLPPGAWYLFMDASGPVGEGNFEAQILIGDLTPPGGNEACDAPARIMLDEHGGFSVRGDTGGANPDVAVESIHCALFGDTEAAADLVYVLTTHEDRWLTADIRPDGWDAVLHVYTDSCTSNELIGCGDEPARVSIPRLPPGQHFLVVDGYRAGEAGTFELTGALAGPPPSPENNLCEDAHLLSFDPETGIARVQGDSTAATDQGEVGCGQAASRRAPDLFYRFTLVALSDVEVQVVPHDGYTPAVALRSGGCRVGVELVCTTSAPYVVSAAALQAGEYLIVIDGAQARSRGLFDLQVTATPIQGD